MAEPITMVATDIVASTTLWERLGEAFQPVLDQHHRILREGVAAFAGYEVRTEGDGFRVAFRGVAEAIRFSLTVQQRLEAATWPRTLSGFASGEGAGGLQVRIGVHTGTPSTDIEPTSGRVDLRGLDLIRTERVAEMAHGGQVLLSEAAARVAEPLCAHGELSTEVELQAIGRWVVPGVEEAMELWQATLRRGAKRVFPPPRARRARETPTNLQGAVPVLYGRAELLERVHAALAGPSRAVLLRGQGGVGKSALLVRYAGAVLSRAETQVRVDQPLTGGIWYVDLAEAASADAIAGAVARVLGLEVARADAPRAVAHQLQRIGPCLLMLDDLDRVAAAAGPLLGIWRRAAPELRLLLASRTHVELAGLVSLVVEPLALPELTEGPVTPAERASLAQNPAMALLLARASKVVPGFQITAGSEGNAAALLGILNRVGGVPLQIELAADRLRVLGPGQIRDRLDAQPLEVLVSRRGGPHDRHHSVRRILDQSWALLHPWEQAALLQLAVFKGGFTAGAARMVVDLSPWPQAPAVEVVLSGLQLHGLLAPMRGVGVGERLHLLQAPRAYTEERLARARGDSPGRPLPRALVGLELRHARTFASLGEPDRLRALSLRGGGMRARALHAELDNLRVAATWAVQAGEAALAASATRALFTLAMLRGTAPEVRTLARDVLALPGLSPADRVDMLRGLGWYTWVDGGFEEGQRALEQAAAEARAAESLSQQAYAQVNLAAVHRRARRFDLAVQLSTAAVAGGAQAQDPVLAGLAHAQRAATLRKQGDFTAAAQDMATSLTLLREAGAVQPLAVALSGQMLLMRSRGEHQAALAAAREAIQLCADASDERGLVLMRHRLGVLYWDMERLTDARRELEVTSAHLRLIGPRSALGSTLWRLAICLVDLGDLHGARQALEEAWAPLRGGTDPGLEVRVAAARGEVEARADAHVESGAWLARAGRIASQAAHPLAEVLITCHRGVAAHAMGDLEGAGHALQDIERQRRVLPPSPTIGRLALRLQRLLTAQPPP